MVQSESVTAQLAAWRVYYLDPRVAMRDAQAPREVDDIGPRGEWIAPFLFRLKGSRQHARSFRAVGRALHAAIPQVDGVDVDLDTRRGILDVQICQDRRLLSSRSISEGTLRLLALCAIAANPWPGRLVAFEEPENGVHPRRIGVVADLLTSLARKGRTQVVVSTHSPHAGGRDGPAETCVAGGDPAVTLRPGGHAHPNRRLRSVALVSGP